MSGKMRIIILAAIAIVGFGVSYLASNWFGGSEKPVPQTASGQEQQADVFAQMVMPESAGPIAIAKRENQLMGLIKEVRLKVSDYKKMNKELEKRERRIQMAGEALKKQAKELEALRMQLVLPLTRMRETIAEMENTRIRIAKEENVNMKHIAQVCEKMDSTSSSQMLTGMCRNNQEDDAVKILYFMSKRSAGKLLSEITDKALAARLCGKLKKVHQEKG